MPSMPNVYSCITRWPSFPVSNRWRAFMYVDFLVQGGLNILSTNRETRGTLPIPLSRIDRMFRSLNEFDLRATALDLVGVRPL